MARVRMPDVCTLNSWDDVNLTLADIAELQREIQTIAANMQQSIDDAKLAAEIATEPIQKKIENLKAQMKVFANDHVIELGKRKTKFLSFGKLGFRKSASVELPKDKNKLAEIIRNIKAYKMNDCLVPQPEKIDKAKLKKYPEDKIRAVGASYTDGDTFWFEVAKEKLESAE